jgi:hypothetical protein
MFFTILGRIVAVFALLIGIWNIVGGLMIATGSLAPEAAALARYFPGKSSSGEVVNFGFYLAIFSVALGILTEISRSVERLREIGM